MLCIMNFALHINFVNQNKITHINTYMTDFTNLLVNTRRSMFITACTTASFLLLTADVSVHRVSHSKEVRKNQPSTKWEYTERERERERERESKYNTFSYSSFSTPIPLLLTFALSETGR